MDKAVRYFFTAIAISTLVLGSMAMAPAARSDALIRLKSGDFVPAQSQFAQQGSQKYFIVQFTGPIQESWKDAVSAEGAEILNYMPDFAFKVRMNPGIANRVRQLSFVSDVISFQSQFKLGTDLKRGGDLNVYQVRIEKGSNYGAVRSLIAQTGAQILSFEEDVLIVAANGSFVDAIAAVDDVASVSNFYLNEKLSNSSGPALNDTA